MSPKDPLERVRALLARAGEPDPARGTPERGSPGAGAVLHRLLAIARAMNQIHERDQLLAFLRDRLRELFDAENSVVVLFEDDGTHRVLSDGGLEPEMSEAVVQRAHTERRAFLVTDARDDDVLSRRTSIERLGIASVLCAPLLVDGSVIGVIQFDHRRHVSPFTDEDLEVLSLFAEQAATALANMQLVERVRDALSRMQVAQERLVVAERLAALGAMASGLAHRFNNVLVSVVGMSDLMLARGDLPERMQSELRTILNGAREGASLVRRLQDFASAAGREERVVAIDLRGVVARVLAENAGSFHPVTGLVSRSELDGVPELAGRPSEFHDLVRGLLRNAIEAQPGSGQVLVRLRAEPDAAVLEVLDDGPGVPPTCLGRIFEPFFTTKPSAHGLGLSLCHGVVRRAGGTIEVRNRDPRGVAVTVRLPFGVPLPPAVLSEPRPVPATARVLVVDDEPAVRRVTMAMLERMRVSAVAVASGALALEQLAREDFQVLLTDHAMPGMTGVQLSSEARRQGFRGSIVLLTGWDPDDSRAKSPPEVDLVLHKPVTTQRLNEALAPFLP